MLVLQSVPNAACQQTPGFGILDRVTAAVIQEVTWQKLQWVIMNRVSGLSVGGLLCRMEGNWELARQKA